MTNSLSVPQLPQLPSQGDLLTPHPTTTLDTLVKSLENLSLTDLRSKVTELIGLNDMLRRTLIAERKLNGSLYEKLQVLQSAVAQVADFSDIQTQCIELQVLYKDMKNVNVSMGAGGDVQLMSKQAGDFLANLARNDIAKLSIFSDADQAFFTHLSTVVIPEVHKADSIIIRSGTEADCMYFLVRGNVQVYSDITQTSNNVTTTTEQIFATMKSGCSFGEVGILYATKRTASVKALEDCYVFKLTKTALDDVVGAFPNMKKTIQGLAEERYQLFLQRSSKRASDASATAGSVAIANANTNAGENSTVNTSTESDSVPEDHDIEISLQNLKRIRLFREVESSVLQDLALKMTRKSFKPNENIINCGDKGDSMFFLTHGCVDIVSEFGQVVDSAEGPDVYVGEVSLIEDVPRTASVRTRTDCSIYVLYKSDMEAVFATCPEVKASVVATAKERMQAHLMRNILA